eukprot:scaffold10462_cov119-Isochrysis_galbana.AAC.11
MAARPAYGSVASSNARILLNTLARLCNGICSCWPHLDRDICALHGDGGMPAAMSRERMLLVALRRMHEAHTNTFCCAAPLRPACRTHCSLSIGNA